MASMHVKLLELVGYNFIVRYDLLELSVLRPLSRSPPRPPPLPSPPPHRQPPRCLPPAPGHRLVGDGAEMASSRAPCTAHSIGGEERRGEERNRERSENKRKERERR